MAKQPINVEVTVNGLSNDTVYLANYYGSRLYYSDTTVADANGHFSFQGKEFNECGKYAIVLPGPVFFRYNASKRAHEVPDIFSQSSRRYGCGGKRRKQSVLRLSELPKYQT